MNNSAKLVIGVCVLLILVFVGILVHQSRDIAALRQAVLPSPSPTPKPLVNWIELHGNVDGAGFAPESTYITTTKAPHVTSYAVSGDSEWMITFVEPTPTPGPVNANGTALPQS